jgi:hypothetical protein
VRFFFGGGELLEGRGEEERGEVEVPVDLLSFFWSIVGSGEAI